MQIDFPELWRVLTVHFALGEWSLHGPNHWKNVERNGLALAAVTGADLVVVRLFAVFHDAERQNESYDPEHGQRAAKFAQQLHGTLFTVSDEQLNQLCFACIWHHQGQVTGDATIGTCWDADRLDLPRVGVRPHPSKMSTLEGKRLAEAW